MIYGFTQTGPTDRGRQLVHLAIAAGRSLQSSQTGFLHYNYRPLDYPVPDTIPLYENFLFSLALFRNRTPETFAEAKSLLDKLLNFQCFEDTLSLGNFPLYLHQFPTCSDNHVGYQLLPVFYWILRDFTLALGSELEEKLNTATRTLLQYCLRLQETTPAPLHLSIKVAAAAEALGRLWNDRQLNELGMKVLDTLREKVDSPDCPIYFTPAHMGNILAALQLAYEDISNGPWRPFWKRVCQGWHIQLASYVGPALRVSQFKEEPEPTLYDLYMGYFADRYSQRSFAHRPFQLQGALIHPAHEIMIQPALPFEASGKIEERRWFVQQAPKYGLGLLQKIDRDASKEPPYALFRLVWGDLNKTHTLVCQGGSSETNDFVLTEDGVDLLFQLPAEVPPEAKQRNREVQFFLDHQEGVTIRTKGNEKANTFQLGEEVQIEARGALRVRLLFSLETGEGRFFGHISLGNRPAQLCTEGPDRFSAFDWQIFLRTISREPGCRLRVSIKWEVGEA